MPDWTYQTLFRPVFFRMSPRQSQGIAIGGLGRLGDFWLGRRVVNFMGHMTPDRSLAFQSRGCYFVSRVALGCGLDAKGIAVGGFNQFGLALLEYGPLHQGAPANAAVDFDESRAEIRLTAPEVSPATGWLDDLPEYGTDGNATPLFLRFSATASIEFVIETIRSANQRVSGVILSHHHWEPVSSQIKSKELEYNGLLLLLMDVVSEPQDLPNSELLAGVRMDGALREGFDGRVMSHERLAPTIDAVKRWRSFFDNLNQDSESDDRQLVIAGGGVHEPLDALKLVEAGADIVAVDSGMVFAGPGLAKRCNELLVQTAFRPQDIVAPSTQPVFAKNVQDEDATTNVAARQSWLWSLLMGISMLGGGLLALVIALTRVVLPYDESVVGMTREQLLQVNDRLLDFMSHDRVTLAGAMLSVGTLYVGLSWFGSRRRAHWAQQSIVISAFVGFFSFFLFLGFGYFDPFHAFVTTILFQFLLLTVYSRMSPTRPPVCLDLHNDDAWFKAQWGQLMFVIQGVVLIVAGSVISLIGITHVLIKEDLEFLCTTPDKIISANPQLLSLVAHDRATFGGMLVCTGITVFLSSMWGFRRGHRWLWWILLISGCFGYLCAIGIHMKVGYTSFKHLLPAYGGFIWLCVSATLSYRYLHDRIVKVPAD